MFQSFFNSLSGLFSFSRSLDTISNNVSNMNTPGFRGQDAFFRSLVNNNGGAGYGTQIADESLRTHSGEIRQTSNPTDLALNGSGFFVLRNEQGEEFYSRAGQFRFDEDGYLVDSVTDYRVAALNDAGNLADINIDELRTLPPEATTTVSLSGNLSPSETTHSIDSFTVFDSQGESVELQAVFTNNDATTPDSWTVDIIDDNGDVVGSGEIRFAADGTPQSDFNSFDITLDNGGESQTITLEFGENGSFSGATQFSGTASNLGVNDVDGHAMVGLQSVSFDAEGVLQLKYANGETETGPRLALAHFNDPSVLRQHEGSLFSSPDTDSRTLGRPDEGLFGTVQGESLEMSNVDLTREFADMMIVQRGYQASSRVMNIASELVEQLYNETRGR